MRSGSADRRAASPAHFAAQPWESLRPVTAADRAADYGQTMISPSPNAEALPDSPYAAELREQPVARRFAPAVEAEYLRSRLRKERTLVRLASTLALLLLGLRALDVLTSDPGKRLSLMAFTAALASTIVLAWLAWSRGYERRYLPWAEVLVPLRNCLIAAHVVRIAAQGQVEILMLLPMLLISPFYFLGLRYRAALLTAALSVASMAATALEFHLRTPMALRGGVLLAVLLVVIAIGARQLEKLSRRSFLENRIVAELSQHDSLTWAKNRRVFDEDLPRLWRQAVSDARSLAILVIDVDDFKAYNDRYGHQSGDTVLRRVALAIQQQARRPLDLVARYGGEEFAVILYDTDGGGARSAAESMRRAVEALAIEHRASRSSTVVTISIGVAVVSPTAGRNALGVVQLADEALYRAKSKGRNRVEMMDDTEHRMMVTGVFSSAEFPAFGQRAAD